MIRTIFLHLGFHKTGSSSVQALLRANRERLGERFGCLVQNDPALRPLEDACRAFDTHPGRVSATRIRNVWDVLMSTMAQGPKVWLISSEDILGRIPSNRDGGMIYANAASILNLLKENAGGTDLVPLVYLRAPDRWLDSIYRHLVRTRGLAMTFQAFRTIPKFARDANLLSEAATRIAREAGLPLRRFMLEDDGTEHLGAGSGLLRALGMEDADLAEMQPVPRQNEGLHPDIVARVSTPMMLRLPRLVRRIIIKRLQRKS